jgi:hypothetical protein
VIILITKEGISFIQSVILREYETIWQINFEEESKIIRCQLEEEDISGLAETSRSDNLPKSIQKNITFSIGYEKCVELAN